MNGVSVKMPDGSVGWLCGGRTPRARCSVCRALGATRLCDGPAAVGRRRRSTTCDAKLCEGCARRRGDLDYCPTCDDVVERAAAAGDAYANDDKGAPL